MFLRVGGVPAGAVEVAGRKYAAVQEVRGRGLIQGLQLAIPARPIVEQALAEGVLFNSTQDTVLRFLPPFLLQEKHVDKGMRVLKKLFGRNARRDTDRRRVPPRIWQWWRYRFHADRGVRRATGQCVPNKPGKPEGLPLNGARVNNPLKWAAQQAIPVEERWFVA